MSALSSALPLALSASVYPPALLVLVLLMTGKHPRRLVLAYFLGAALVVVGSGLVALAVFNGSGATTQSSSTASAWVYFAFGVALLALAAFAWRRAGRVVPEPEPAAESPAGEGGRVAAVMHRATTSQKWAFVLGLLMYLPSPMYLLAVKDIADSGSSTSSAITAVLICAVAVMLFVEVPLVALFVRPDGVSAAINSFHGWIKRNGWRLASVLALFAGIYALVQGVDTMS